MRRTAISMAAVSFFVLAGVGYASGVSCLTCALRALAGAGVIYVLVAVCGQVIANMIVSTLRRKAAARNETNEPDRG